MIIAPDLAQDEFLEPDVLEVPRDVADGHMACFQNAHSATSHIVQELVVVLLVYPAADPEEQQRLKGHQEMVLRRGNGPVDHDQAEIADEEIDRVRQKSALDCGAVIVHGIEDRGHVHDELSGNAPEILHVPEEDIQRREDHAHAEIEEQKKDDRVNEHNQPPREGDMVQNAEEKEHDQGQAEVDEALDVFGHQEQILRHIDLRKDGGVAQKRGHALVRGFAEEGEDQVAAEQIGRVMRGAAPEKLGEHQAHDQQHQQRRQDAPGHAQHRALIFGFEVAFDQLLKEELVGFEFLKHNNIQLCL